MSRRLAALAAVAALVVLAAAPARRTPVFTNSLFGRDVTAQPLVASSAHYVDRFVYAYQHFYGSVGINQIPIFTVPASQPLVPLGTRTDCASSAASTGPSAPIPVGAYTTDPAYQHDSAMIVSQPATHSDWELWKAEPATAPATGWVICHGGKLDPSTSDGVFPSPWGLSATGISYLATTITEADVASGSIGHALAVDLPLCTGHVLPADRGDCSWAGTDPPEGSWWRMAPGTPMPAGLTPLAQMVFKTLLKHGAVQTDFAGAVVLQGETRADWAFSGHTGPDPITVASNGKPQYAVLNGMPWASLQVVVPPTAGVSR